MLHLLLLCANQRALCVVRMILMLFALLSMRARGVQVPAEVVAAAEQQAKAAAEDSDMED